MIRIENNDLRTRTIDKHAIRQIVADHNRQIGFIPDPTATPERIREQMQADGIRPEDNVFSCGIISARDEE